MTATGTPRTLAFATWNVHGGIGRDGRFAPARIAAVVAELDADVVALQEVGAPSHEDDLFATLHALPGYSLIGAPTHRRSFGPFGNALLTRLPVVSVRTLDLAVSGREPRNALDVVVEGAAARVRVFATHLGLRPGERRQQVRRLLAALEDGARMTTVLMGDLNEWFLWGRPLRWLHAHFRRTPAPATFPSARPLFALDRLWVEPASRLQRLWAHRSPLARVASDHLPVIARIAAGPGNVL